MKTRFVYCCLGLLSLSSCSDSDDDPVEKTSTASSSETTSTASANGSALTGGGFGGSTGGSSGNTMTSGVTSSGAGGSGNAGADLTPEDLRDATYDECGVACATEHEACPSIAQEDCFGSCAAQAEGAFTSGSCGLELYQALYCINRQLEISEITCPSSPGGAPMFDGCLGEQARYADCS